MPLTPEDVRKKTFTPVRLREGYDMGEVDQFLDEVEVELTRLLKDNDGPGSGIATAGTASPETGPDKVAAAESTPEPARSTPPAPLPVVKTVPEASSAAARLLEIATNNADQLVSEAQSQADGIIGSARTKAERLEGDAKSKAEQLDSEARARAQRLEAETTEKRQQMFGELERNKESLTRELEELRAFEREYRSRLKGYFQSQLRALDGETTGDVALTSSADGDVALTPSADGDTPRRLRELLGEEQP